VTENKLSFSLAIESPIQIKVNSEKLIQKAFGRFDNG